MFYSLRWLGFFLIPLGIRLYFSQGQSLLKLKELFKQCSSSIKGHLPFFANVQEFLAHYWAQLCPILPIFGSFIPFGLRLYFGLFLRMFSPFLTHFRPFIEIALGIRLLYSLENKIFLFPWEYDFFSFPWE